MQGCVFSLVPHLFLFCFFHQRRNRTVTTGKVLREMKKVTAKVPDREQKGHVQPDVSKRGRSLSAVT